MGIHYDYKSTRGAKAMEKQAKREKKLAEKRAKKQAKAQEKGIVEKIKKEDQTIPLDTVITLDHLTNPDKNNNFMNKKRKPSKVDLENALRKI